MPSVYRSTDSELKLWDLNKGIVRTYKGHFNEKNFVGLSVTPHFIACGEFHQFFPQCHATCIAWRIPGDKCVGYEFN